MRRTLLAFSLACTSVLLAAPRGQQSSVPPTVPAPPKSGFRAEFLHDLDDVQKKIVSLAEAMPAEKYKWRPGPGVRSVSEVYMHIAGGNYFLASFVGMKMPSYDTARLETIGEKPRVLEELKKSFDPPAHGRAHCHRRRSGEVNQDVRQRHDGAGGVRHRPQSPPRAPRPVHRVRTHERRGATVEREGVGPFGRGVILGMMSDEKNGKPGVLRDQAFDPFRPVVDPINGVDLGSMMRNLRLTPAERLHNNTVAAINIARLRNAARRGR